jgi:hypothetical protein
MKQIHPLARFLCRVLPLLLMPAMACFGQRNREPLPDLGPVEGAQLGSALVAKLLAQKPEQNGTNTGWLKITDPEGKEREIPIRFEVTLTPTNWASVYETLPSAVGPGGVKLTVIHSGAQPNRYELLNHPAASAANAIAKQLEPNQIMAPFADSDFWIADLGLEFLHWPKQRLLERNVMSHSKAAHKLESINPAPVPGGYAKVVSWIMIESPYGLLHADAYDAQGRVFKRFDPIGLEKVQGEYQLEKVEMRNSKTDSRTVIKFNLARE